MRLEPRIDGRGGRAPAVCLEGGRRGFGFFVVRRLMRGSQGVGELGLRGPAYDLEFRHVDPAEILVPMFVACDLQGDERELIGPLAKQLSVDADELPDGIDATF